VRKQSPEHRFLHFATHGFFAPPAVRSALAGPVKAEDRCPCSLFSKKDVTGFHPGLLSGLVLAGANRPVQTDRDDGILTALEVEELDLAGVELATLSACETGLGESAGGEGLLGLQRAFQLAGARSVVASLWQLQDDAARALMIDFYENLWRKKMSKLEALRQAQLTMLREGVKRGLVPADDKPAGEKKRLPPYYWAAFELSGDWR
jgi:CHAT domain-containing protein